MLHMFEYVRDENLMKYIKQRWSLCLLHIRFPYLEIKVINLLINTMIVGVSPPKLSNIQR